MVNFLFMHRMLLVIQILCLACCASTQGICPVAEKENARVFIINQGLHSGIALERRSLEPLKEKFPWLELHRGAYLEFGYGDAYYYPEPDPGWIAGAKALLVPGPAVIHISAINEDPRLFFSAGTVNTLSLSPAALAELVSFFNRSLELSADGRPVMVARGLYGDSAFYRATDPFSLGHNCNDWVILALKAAGCKVSRPWVSTSGSVLKIGASEPES